MPDRVGLPNSLPLRYVGPGVDLIPIKRFPRNPTTTDKRYPVGQFAILGENPSSGSAGDLWYLSEFTGGDAIWLPLTGGGSGTVISLSDTADTKTYSDATGNIKLNGSTGIIITSDPGNNTIDFTTPGGGPPIEEVVVDTATAPGVSPVVPSGTGQITVSGAAVANHSVPLETHTRAVNAYNIEVQYAAAAAATDATKSGVAHFNSSQFSVDANGFVELSGGGIALDSIGVQAISGGGTNPVLPDGAGKIEFEGARVPSGTDPVLAASTAANTVQIQVQTSQALAATDATKVGLCNFNSSQFSVDANGFVELTGGGAALDSLGVQSTSGAGTDPVLPDGTGKIEVEGALVAAGTTPVQSESTAANTLQIQVQTAQAIAAEDSTKVGLCNFDSDSFSVSAAGFVTATLNQSTGSITPILKFGGATTGITYSVQTGTYYQIGNVMFVNMLFTLSNKGSASGNASVAGFPAAANGATQMRGYFAATSANVDANTYNIGVNLDDAVTEANLFFGITGSPTSGPNINEADFTNGTSMRIVGFYFVS